MYYNIKKLNKLFFINVKYSNVIWLIFRNCLFYNLQYTTQAIVNMTNYKLVYFNLRARAELARMIFHAAGQPFEDFRYERSEWPAHKQG